MGPPIAIAEHGASIVVTLSGSTEIAALGPIKAALEAAASKVGTSEQRGSYVQRRAYAPLRGNMPQLGLRRQRPDATQKVHRLSDLRREVSDDDDYRVVTAVGVGT